MFSYNVVSTRDGNSYSGVMVGTNPFGGGAGRTSVPTQIVPIVIVTQTIGTAINFTTGVVSTTPGVTVFDPTAPNSCLTAPNNIPLRLVRQSPISQSTDFNFGGTDVGRTHYVDAFQRANFWDVINRGDYHVRLGPVTVLSPIVIHLAASNGLALSPSIFNNCGPLGLIEGGTFDDFVTKNILPSLAAQGVNPSTFPIFLLSNVGLTFGSPRTSSTAALSATTAQLANPSRLIRRLISTPPDCSVRRLSIRR